MLDEWSGLADLLANLIDKYAADLDTGDMPDTKIDMENKVELLEILEKAKRNVRSALRRNR